VSVLNAVHPSARNLLIDQLVPGVHLNMKFHATIMAGQGDPVIEVMESTAQAQKGEYVFVMEGSVATAEDGAFAAVGERDGEHVSIATRVEELAENCLAIIALGTCAAYGGLFAASPNPTGCKGVGEFLKERGIEKPIVNVPGCPPHPDWFVGTVASVLLNGLPGPDDVDDIGRPKVFYGGLIHDNCPRRGFFDAGQFAKKLSDPGCLYELGCMGPQTYADCPTRQWNNGVNWCVGNGSPCQACVEPEFPDGVSPLYRKFTRERLDELKIATRA